MIYTIRYVRVLEILQRQDMNEGNTVRKLASAKMLKLTSHKSMSSKSQGHIHTSSLLQLGLEKLTC